METFDAFSGASAWASLTRQYQDRIGAITMEILLARRDQDRLVCARGRGAEFHAAAKAEADLFKLLAQVVRIEGPSMPLSLLYEPADADTARQTPKPQIVTAFDIAYPTPWRLGAGEVVDRDGCNVQDFDDTADDREFWRGVVAAVNAAAETMPEYERGRRDMLNALLAPNPHVSARLAAVHDRPADLHGRPPFDLVYWIAEVAEQLGILPLADPVNLQGSGPAPVEPREG